MFAPCGVFLYSLMIASSAVCGVEYATNDKVTVGFEEPDVEVFELLPQAATAMATAITNVSAVTSREVRGCTGRPPGSRMSTTTVDKLEYMNRTVKPAGHVMRREVVEVGTFATE